MDVVMEEAAPLEFSGPLGEEPEEPEEPVFLSVGVEPVAFAYKPNEKAAQKVNRDLQRSKIRCLFPG
jgi:hypothetical protein